jgi:hypothetical protein
MTSEIAINIRLLASITSPFIVLFLIFYLLFEIPIALFGTRKKRGKRAKRATIVTATAIFVPLIIGLLAHYVWLSELRRTVHGCYTEASDDGKYLATRCFLNSGYFYLRLYDAQTQKLLASTTYKCYPADPKLVVGDNIVFDGCESDSSEIPLPPPCSTSFAPNCHDFNQTSNDLIVIPARSRNGHGQRRALQSTGSFFCPSESWQR